METKKLHFETLQLHVGQEQPDPAPMRAPCPFTKLLHTYSVTQPMLPHASVCKMRVIFTVG